MNKKFKPLNLASMVLGPGYNNKRGYTEIGRVIWNASKAVGILSENWKDLDSFLNTIYKTSDINPFTGGGLSGSTLLIKSNITSSHPYFWNGTRSYTIFESIDRVWDSTTVIKADLEKLSSLLTKLSGLNAKKRFSQLTDTPNQYYPNQYIRVKGDASGLENTSSLIPDNSFLGLGDVPDSYIGHADKIVSTLSDLNGVFFESIENFKSQTEGVLSALGTSGTHTLSSLGTIQLGGAIYLVDRHISQTGYIELGPTFSGSEVVFRNNNNPGAGLFPVRVQGVGSSGISVENEPIELNDSRNFLHLIFHSGSSKYMVVGYQ